MKASGSMNDIAGSVKVYLKKKQQQRSLAEEVVEVRLSCAQLAVLPSHPCVLVPTVCFVAAARLRRPLAGLLHHELPVRCVGVWCGARRRAATDAMVAAGTWFVLGLLSVLYMRQRVVQLSWRQALALTGVLSAYFTRELALPANAFYSFFSRYVLLATLVTAAALRLLPPRLASELPDVLFRLGFLQRGRGRVNGQTT